MTATRQPARICAVCSSWPCVCARGRIAVLETRPTSAMSEAELLAGYLGVTRILPRSERCLCGDVIRVEDGSDEWLVGRAVRFHNNSTAHAQWAVAAGWRHERAR